MDVQTIQHTKIDLNREKVLVTGVSAGGFTLTDSDGNLTEIKNGHWDLRQDLVTALAKNCFTVEQLKAMQEVITCQLEHLENLEHNAAIQAKQA